MSRFPLRSPAVPLLVCTLLLGACKEEGPETLLASARGYLDRHDGRTAVIQVKNALQKSPDLPEARFLLGRAFLEEGNAVAAELELRKALELKHPADQVAPWLARSLLAQGKPEKVVEEFSGLDSASPESRADLQTTLGLALAGRGETVAAQAALAQALEARPGYPPALLAQARLKAAGRDYPGALALLDSLLAEGGDQEAWKLKGDILRVQGQPEPALAAYRKALELKPDFVPAHAAVLSGLMQLSRLDEAARQIEALRKVAPGDPQTLYLDGLLAFLKGDFDRARGPAQELLRIAPDSPLALQLAGAVEYRQKAWANAEHLLAKALRLAPDLFLARRILLAAYLENGQPAKALAELPPLLEKAGEDSQVLALAGQVYAHNGDLQKAEQYFSRAAALDPEDAGKRTSLAIARMMKGQVEPALGELEKIAATDPGTAADLALIGTFMERNSFEQALQAIATLERKQPGQPLADTLRGRVQARLGQNAEARKSFERALAKEPSYFPAISGLAGLDLAEKKPEAAKKRFESLLAADPRHVRARLALAELSRQGGASPEEVASLLASAVAADPAASAPRLILIEHYLRGRNAGKAVAAAQEAVSSLPDRPELLDALGMAQQLAGNLNQALATYGKLAALQPDSPQPQVRMADIHRAAGNRDEALRSLRRGLEIKPGGELAARVHAQLLEGGGPEADKFARAWLKEHPGDAAFLAYLGDKATARKDWETAARHYRTLLERQPDNPAVLNNLAWVAGQQKNPRALEYAEKANRLAPDQPALMDTLAMLLAEKGNTRRALELLRKAVELAPGAAPIRLNLARVLIKSGDRTAARQELEALSRLGDKFPRQGEIAQLLKEV